MENGLLFAISKIGCATIIVQFLFLSYQHDQKSKKVWLL